jgi:hypothetical protein
MKMEGKRMAPQEFTRIPMQVGTEVRLTKSGEVRVSNPSLELEPAQDAADAVLAYRFDPATGEYILRLLEPTVWSRER